MPSTPANHLIFDRTFKTEQYGSVKARIAVTMMETSAPCVVCDGTRNALATLQIDGIIQELHGIERNLSEEDIANIAHAIRGWLEKKGAGKVVCLECQKDFFRPQTKYRG